MVVNKSARIIFLKMYLRVLITRNNHAMRAEAKHPTIPMPTDEFAQATNKINEITSHKYIAKSLGQLRKALQLLTLKLSGGGAEGVISC